MEIMEKTATTRKEALALAKKLGFPVDHIKRYLENYDGYTGTYDAQILTFEKEGGEVLKVELPGFTMYEWQECYGNI